MSRNTSITLGKHFADFVLEKINAGCFQSVSEIVHAGLRKLEEDEPNFKCLEINYKQEKIAC